MKMDEMSMKKALSSMALSEGALGEDQLQAWIAKKASQCPAHVDGDYDISTETGKAYYVAMLETGQVGGGAAAPNAVMPTPTALPAQAISQEERNKIVSGVTRDKEKRVAMSQSVVIEKLVTDKPSPETYILKGTKGVIPKEHWQTIEAKWKDKVLPDEEGPDGIKSTTNFGLLKQAAESGSQVDVYVPGPSKRVVAVTIQIPDAQGMNKQSKNMSVSDFENFVVLETQGYVLAKENNPGAKLRYIKATPDKKNPGAMKPERVVLAFTRKNAAQYEASSMVTDKEMAATCKSDLCFKVDTGKYKNDGHTKIYRTVRVSVKTVIKEVVRKDAFIDVLGTGKGGNKDMLQAPNPDEMKKISQAIVTKIASLRQKVNDDIILAGTFGEQLKAFDKVESSAPAPNPAGGLQI